MIIGCARVTTDDLKAPGCDRIFAVRISDRVRGRPAFGELLDDLRAGDLIAVTTDDRLARSLRDR